MEHEDIDFHKCVTEGSLDAVDAVFGREGPKTVSEANSVGSLKKKIGWTLSISKFVCACCLQPFKHASK